MAAVTRDLHQQGVAEAGDVRFAVAQRLGSAIMLLQEVRSWLGRQNALLGYELFTDVELDTTVATPREFACDVRDFFFWKGTLSSCNLVPFGVLSIFFATTVLLHRMICGRC